MIKIFYRFRTEWFGCLIDYLLRLINEVGLDGGKRHENGVTCSWFQVLKKSLENITTFVLVLHKMKIPITAKESIHALFSFYYKYHKIS